MIRSGSMRLVTQKGMAFRNRGRDNCLTGDVDNLPKQIITTLWRMQNERRFAVCLRNECEIMHEICATELTDTRANVAPTHVHRSVYYFPNNCSSRWSLRTNGRNGISSDCERKRAIKLIRAQISPINSVHDLFEFTICCICSRALARFVPCVLFLLTIFFYRTRIDKM